MRREYWVGVGSAIVVAVRGMEGDKTASSIFKSIDSEVLSETVVRRGIDASNKPTNA